LPQNNQQHQYSREPVSEAKVLIVDSWSKDEPDLKSLTGLYGGLSGDYLYWAFRRIKSMPPLITQHSLKATDEYSRQQRKNIKL